MRIRPCDQAVLQRAEAPVVRNRPERTLHIRGVLRARCVDQD